ncbi:hypothetical protein BVRB_6g128610 [Beta vulgaris subsp. vulgaris]|nr:hypothetical protein BVRB_6g128610 [Beta vulgaris subsp. vulgaris]
MNNSKLALRGFSLSLLQLRSLHLLQSHCCFSHTPSLRRNSNEDDPNLDPQGPPKILVVQPRVRPNTHLQTKLNEALNLANSLDEQRDGFFSTDLSLKNSPPHLVVQNPLSGSNKSRSDTYFGPGTVDNIKCHIHAIESKHDDELDAVFVNAILSAIQQRNLERVWEKPVLDRVGLIIEIFNAHAYTKEAKLQAELAAIMYKKSRLVRARGSDGRYTFGTKGEAEVVSARGRGSGGRGFISGAGETELELQRRRISERRKRLLAEIEVVRRTRAVQRAGRRKQGVLDAPGLASVAVVGYTNAGKSTLVSALSDTDLYSDDRLFATVDPKVRGVTLPSGRKVLLSDTVGFISDLPVQLVEAFHATLEEVVEADLLVHVLDSSAPNLEEQRQAVLDVLQRIGVSGKKIQDMIEVWNKIDIQRDTDTGVENFNDDFDSKFEEDEDEVTDEQLLQKDKMQEDQRSEFSSDRLGPGVEPHDQKGEFFIVSRMKEKGPDSHPESEHVPHVKTSAVARIGLQELLGLIDEKLVQNDKEQQSSQIVLERGKLDRKWRPPQAEKIEISVE